MYSLALHNEINNCLIIELEKKLASNCILTDEPISKHEEVVDEEEALEALAKVGLADRAHHLPAQLSGGEQQRVCIARALINSPQILLGDEPTGNLDEENEGIVVDIFRRLHEEGVTIIVVTHDPEVGDVAQRKIILEHGRVVDDIDQSATFGEALKLKGKKEN